MTAPIIPVRLVDGDSSTGLVEVYYSGRWGLVCGSNWGDFDAQVWMIGSFYTEVYYDNSKLIISFIVHVVLMLFITYNPELLRTFHNPSMQLTIIFDDDSFNIIVET